MAAAENGTTEAETPMRLSTDHEILPDASIFADVLGPQLIAHELCGERSLTFRAVQLPALRVPSGLVTASDGYVTDVEFVPFTQVVPAGEHLLFLGLAETNGDERVAFAKLQLTDVPASRWEMATVPGEDVKSLQPGELSGYGVDSGTGCLGDSEAFKIVAGADDDFADKMMAESQKVYQHTRDWVSVETTKGSLAVFSSGYGDGCYCSYFGYSAAGEVISLVTDFNIVKWAATPADA